MPEEEQLESLLARTALGDRAAFRRLYERTSAKLFGLVLRILRDRGEAEDVLQETYLRVWRNAARYAQAKASPITWMATIARNGAIDRLRSRKTSGVGIEAIAEFPDTRPTAEEEIQSADARGGLERCLETLERDAQAIVRRAFFGEITYERLAESEGLPLGTIKSRIRRSLMKLRLCLEQ